MKKLILASAIAMGLVSGAASANGEVHFVGAVSDITCDITPEVDGTITKNTVQLGTVAPGAKGTPVSFKLKAANPAAPGCAALTDTNTATIGWFSPALNSVGIGAQSGTAKDANVLLSTVNAKGTAITAITKSNTVTDFVGDLAIKSGFQYTATLQGGTDTGDFMSSATFNVAYK